MPVREDVERLLNIGGQSGVTLHAMLPRRTEVDVAMLPRSRSGAHTLFTPDIHSSHKSKGYRIKLLYKKFHKNYSKNFYALQIFITVNYYSRKKNSETVSHYSNLQKRAHIHRIGIVFSCFHLKAIYVQSYSLF